ncbi:MAG: hypothetical protein JW751_03640 [Polyangiaceae bacterium]|nr:hypothetical protein [Polyangiaceae bacterium]
MKEPSLLTRGDPPAGSVRPRSVRPGRFASFGLLGAAIVAVLGVRVAAADSPRDTYRYPYDPVCSWGRVANGRGMIVRCLTRVEAESLGAAAGPPRPGAASRPSATAAPSAAPSGAAPTVTRALAVEVGPIVADAGSLPLALGKLKVPSDRYLACVRDHGGVARDVGEVKVRFLVRERGRAEGVVVSKRTNVTEDAARCIADVVDRRFVGKPDEPMVGATLTVKVRESSK